MDLRLQPSPAPRGEDAFTHWLSACGDDPWTPLTPQAAKPYGFIWGAWLKYLAAAEPAATAHAWQQATPEQVLHFLNTATRSQKQLDQPSDITRRRYWRVLDRIYAHAQLHGWVQHNPVDGLAAQDRPPSEDPQGAILTPSMWRALIRQIPAATDLITARDRAVLMVLIHLGITSEEIRGLQLDDVQWPPHADAAMTAPAQPALPHALRLTGQRAVQERSLPLPKPAAQAMRDWLGYRAAYASMHAQTALFCTRKAPEISTHTVLHLVSKTLKAAAQARKLPLPPRMGPQVIRNTLIVQWLRSGQSIPAVLARAGLRSPHALSHLQHLYDL